MWNFRRLISLPIALDLDSDGIRMLQMGSEESAPCVIAAARRFFLSDDKSPISHMADDLRRTLDAAPFTTDRVTASLPRAIVHFRTLRISSAKPNNIEADIRSAAAELFPFDLNAATVRWFDAGLVRQAGEERREVIVAAAACADIEIFLGQLHNAGLRAEALRLAPFAAFRCARRAAIYAGKPTEDATLALVKIGTSSSTVVISRGQSINFLRQIEIGSTHINEAVSRKLNLTLDEVLQLRQRLTAMHPGSNLPRDGVAGAVFDTTRGVLEKLAQEVANCFRYHAVTFPGQKPDRVFLMGTEAADPHVCAALAGVLPAVPQEINLFAGIDTTAMRGLERDAATGEWTTCIGLALGAMDDEAGVPRSPKRAA